MRERLGVAARLLAPALFGVALGLGLLVGGLGLPGGGPAAAESAGPPRRPPILSPAVPLGAPEHLALYSYVERINLAWGRDWPTVIRLFEEFDARYPRHPVTVDSLYAAYVEHAKERWRAGDVAAARARLNQAAAFDPTRPEAPDLLAELERVAPRGR